MQEPVQQDCSPEVQAVNERASAAMKRGLALLEKNSPASLREAVMCFDDAIALRKNLPLAEHPWIRYGLIAGWMNRGDALTRLGGAQNLAEAIRNYDEALLQLRELPMNESPLFKKRLAIAWLNRGVTLQKIGSPDALSKALQSFDEAIVAAQNLFVSGYREIIKTLACAWMNRGNVLLQLEPPQGEQARMAEQKAMALLKEIEKESVQAAELALKARHILCQALAQLLVGRVTPCAPIGDVETNGAHGVTRPTSEECFAEASDVVDEGMALARHWQARGAKQFSSLANDLFRFGCRVYQIHQPHFLTEFLLENLDHEKSPDAFAGNNQMQFSAVEALWRNFQEIQRDGFTNINSGRFDEFLESLRDLRITEERLSELRQHANL